ncbi:MAG TPA: ATP-binding protein [Myxococcaceae bacterium]|nr:ATP-binding protein [Myxococcaceae bacterium]
MTLEIGPLFAAALGYLLLLFLIAYATERGLIPARVSRHPLTYALSLGVYATSWTYYGSVGFARGQGYNFLAIYLGVTLSCLLIGALWMPVLRVIRDNQLTSLADLFAFRYQSQAAGVLVTLFMIACSLPYLALQIRAVTESVRVLTQFTAPGTVGLAFCALVTLFAILFGARHVTARERHEGLVVAIAFESVVKLAALLMVAGIAVFLVFGGFSGMENWLRAHPLAVESLFRPVREGPWKTLLLLSFAAGFLLPRQFHMAFTESLNERGLHVASWAFPLFLLLLNLAVPAILWAGMELLPSGNADFYVLTVARRSGSTLLSGIAFLGGLSAASAMLIVDTLALAAMCLNHLVLPRRDLAKPGDLYSRLLWARRALIAAIILAGYCSSIFLDRHRGLVELGLVSFVAVAQFLPGLFGVLFWRRATRLGFIAGLMGGIFVWAATLFVPLLTRSGLLPNAFDISALFGIAPGREPWSIATLASLSINGLLFGALSLATRPTHAEERAASACAKEVLAPELIVVAATSPVEFQERLAPLLGPEAAELEVAQALGDLEMTRNERRPAQLQRLRERIQRNLSGLVGPLVARMIVDEGLRLDTQARPALSDRLRFLEETLRESRAHLPGPAAELEAFRRYLRRILEDLPLGVCALGPDRDVVIWNRALEALAGISANEATGGTLQQLEQPVARALAEFAARPEPQQEIRLGDRFFSLSKSVVDGAALPRRGTSPSQGLVMLVEDVSERKALASQVAHQDRLASIGRLAAGIAHEIGNPLTGIACIAQNLAHEDNASVLRDRVRSILEQAQRIDAIVRGLLSFSRSGSDNGVQEVETFSLREAVGEAIALVQLDRTAKNIPCENKCPSELTIEGDRQRLLQVFVNLLSNAFDASRPGERVWVEAKVQGGDVRVLVIDQGTGIPEAVRQRIFEPFFTTKEPGQGTGLGLPLAYSIVREHQGTMEVNSALGAGTTVVLQLPLRQKTAPLPRLEVRREQVRA